MVLHPLPQYTALVFQQRLRRWPILRRQVIDVLRKPLAGQNVLQNDQHPQILLCLDAEEGGNPAKRLCPIRVGLLKRLHSAHIIARTVTIVIEGVVDNQLPSLIGIFERRVGQLTDVPKQHDARPFGLEPQKVMRLLELQLSGNPELLEQHLPYASDAVPLIVLSTCLFNDRLGIDTGELNGDGWVRLFTNANLTHTGRPAPAASEHFLTFPAGNRRLDRTMIQRGEPLSVQCAQRLYAGHKC